MSSATRNWNELKQKPFWRKRMKRKLPSRLDWASFTISFYNINSILAFIMKKPKISVWGMRMNERTNEQIAVFRPQYSLLPLSWSCFCGACHFKHDTQTLVYLVGCQGSLSQIFVPNECGWSRHVCGGRLSTIHPTRYISTIVAASQWHGSWSRRLF